MTFLFNSGSSVTDYFKSLFENKKEQDLQSLKNVLEKHGWQSNKDATHFSLCKEFVFESRQDASEFLLGVVTESKTSNHIHLEVNAEKTIKLEVNVYSDDEQHDNNCLKLCLNLDELFDEKRH